MPSAKEIRVKPITASAANKVIKQIHYSGKVVPNSQLHFGVFLNGALEGAMQFGPSMDKSKLIGLVENTQWNGFIELNRMAFSEVLPRNSESRAIAVAMRLIRKHYPWIEWVISFADATQCGDGTIYRAAGFVLTQINKNKTLRINPATGEIVSNLTMTAHRPNERAAAKTFKALPGYQMRYLYFLNPEARKRLTVPVLPFSAIKEAGAAMYKGLKRG